MSANPYRKTVIVCAQCGRQKGESNHWFVLTPAGLPGDLYCISRFAEALLDRGDALPACGDECLQKLASALRATKEKA